MSLADALAELNEWHFFREFVYSKNVFKASGERELELADSLLWLGDTVVAFQLKERATVPGATPEGEAKWFRKKVLGIATKQIRDTITFLQGNKSIPIQNHRGHTVDLALTPVTRLQKLIVYAASGLLPSVDRNVKFYRSRAAGVIHLIESNDYRSIVKTLLTPAEVVDYLAFREELIGVWDTAVGDVHEMALVGQYLLGDVSQAPTNEFLELVARLDHRADEWDMSGVITKFPDRMTADGEATDYYFIVTELALLKRNQLTEFKLRLLKSVEKVNANELVKPYRMEIPERSVGFVFIPLTRDLVGNSRTALLNFMAAHKYDRHLNKCVGLTIFKRSDDQPGDFTVEWGYLQSEWEHDAEMEEQLRSNPPFRPVKEKQIDRYRFGGNK